MHLFSEFVSYLTEFTSYSQLYAKTIKMSTYFLKNINLFLGIFHKNK